MNSNKVHLLEDVSSKDHFHNLIFVSAKYKHRPPLFDKDTATERDSPKKINEGEKEKTHVSIKYNNDEAIFLMEDRPAGISIAYIVIYFVKYLNKLTSENPNQENFNIDKSIIPKSDFLTELDKLKRVRGGEIYFSKRLLGSEFLNLSNRTNDIKETIVLSLTAKRKRNIQESMKEFYINFVSRNTEIEKIRVRGITEQNHKAILDTEIMKKIEYIEIKANEITGVIDSTEFFYHINRMMNGASI